MNIYLIPAYGKQYKTKQEVINAWKAGVDFKIVNGPYCSIRDLEKLKRDFDNVSIRANTLLEGMQFHLVSNPDRS